MAVHFMRSYVNLIAGTGITLTIVESDGADTYKVTIDASASGSGHTIQDDDTAKTARTNLSFQDGFVVTDDAAGDQTEIDVSYGAAGYPLDVADTEDDGTAITVARSDHVHSGAAYLKESDFTGIDFLVGTATGVTAAEIVAGTAPGGELGGTWGSPTVDATHSGSAHHTQSHDHSAAGDGTALVPATLTLPGAVTPAQTAEGSAVWDTDNDLLTIGDSVGRQTFLPVVDATSDPLAVDATVAADGTEATAARKDHRHAHGTMTTDVHTNYRQESVDHTHQSTGAEAGQLDHGLALTGLTDDDHTQYMLESLADAKGDVFTATAADTPAVLTVGANDTILMADSTAATGLKWAAAAGTAEIADIADAEAAGTSDTYARGDHVHSAAAYRKEADPRHLVTFSKEGNLATGTGTTRWYNDTGASIILDSARGSVGTAPATQSILVDVNNNGTSVWNTTQANRITIAAAGNTDEGGAFDDSTIADGEYITVDIDQVGTGTVGADLTVSIWGHNA